MSKTGAGKAITAETDKALTGKAKTAETDKALTEKVATERGGGSPAPAPALKKQDEVRTAALSLAAKRYQVL